MASGIDNVDTGHVIRSGRSSSPRFVVSGSGRDLAAEHNVTGGSIDSQSAPVAQHFSNVCTPFQVTNSPPRAPGGPLSEESQQQITQSVPGGRLEVTESVVFTGPPPGPAHPGSSYGPIDPNNPLATRRGRSPQSVAFAVPKATPMCV